MSSIVTAVFKTTIGLLVNKARDKAAEKLKDGDVTDQKFRGLIVREIDDIKSKLDGLSRKDLLASISFFEEGIELLYEVFDKAISSIENGAVTTQAACAETFSLAEGIGNLKLIDLDESAARVLSSAKKRFEDCRRKATEAFNNEALEARDRILAMQYRVMATILEKVDNPADAIAPCKVCVKELNSLPAVHNSFSVQLKKGIQALKGLFGKEEREKVISGVCHVNRVIYDVTQAVGRDISFWNWPAVDIGEDKVDPLRDERVTEVLRKLGMQHCCVTPWSFGREGEEGHKLNNPWGIATNSRGEFIVGDHGNVKVFDRSGKFVKLLRLPIKNLHAFLKVATDMNDKIYVLFGCEWFSGKRSEIIVYELNGTDEQHHHNFPVRGEYWCGLTVTESSKVLVLRSDNVIDVYETDGQFVCSFGEDILKDTCDITAANDGRVVAVDKRDSCVHIFSEHGDHLNMFKLQESYSSLLIKNCRIAFHRASEHVVFVGIMREKPLHVEIYTKDGEFVRSIQINDERICFLPGVTVTTGGCIAILLGRVFGNYKVSGWLLVL